MFPWMWMKGSNKCECGDIVEIIWQVLYQLETKLIVMEEGLKMRRFRRQLEIKKIAMFGIGQKTDQTCDHSTTESQKLLPCAYIISRLF